MKLAISLVADFSQYTLGNSTHAREIVHKLELSSVLTIVDGLAVNLARWFGRHRHRHHLLLYLDILFLLQQDVYRLKFSYPLRDCLLLEGTSAHSLQGVAALADLPPVTVSLVLLV